jgi:hypothetical protein
MKEDRAMADANTIVHSVNLRDQEDPAWGRAHFAKAGRDCV